MQQRTASASISPTDAHRTTSPHYRMTPELAQWEYEHGFSTVKGYIYHLIKSTRKDGHRFKIPNVRAFCKERRISKSAFYDAIAALKTEGLMNFEVLGAIELWVSSASVQNFGQVSTFPDTESRISDTVSTFPDTESRISDTQSSKVALELNSGDPPDLLHLSYRSITPTPVQSDRVCVENEQGKECNFSEDVSPPNQKFGKTHTPKVSASSEPSMTAPELNKAQQLGVNLGDRKLKQAIAKFPNRVPRAVAALVEKFATVRYPTRFLEKALLEGWQPETTPNGEFNQWYNDAKRHNCPVMGSQLKDGVQWVFSRDGRCYPWDDLRSLSWEDVTQQLNAAPSPDLSDLLAAIEVEVRCLAWSREQLQAFLHQTYGVSERRLLSDGQLLDLLSLLQTREAQPAQCV